MKKIIGLTGTTGAGKSTISNEFYKKGFFVIDCDKVAKQVVETDKNTLDQLCNEFGADILNDDGILNRRLLASRAFVDKNATKKLNSITLPAIINNINELISSCNSDYILLDAPTLFESGANSICSAIVGVICDDETRKSRIILRDNITEEEALARMSIQKSNDFFKENCTYIIENNSTIDNLAEKAQSVIDEILKG